MKWNRCFIHCTRAKVLRNKAFSSVSLRLIIYFNIMIVH